MPGPTEIFPSADSAVDPSSSGIASTTLYPTEFLNSINIGGSITPSSTQSWISYHVALQP